MSIASITSCSLLARRIETDRNGYRFETTMSIGRNPSASSAARSSGRSRRASSPLCTAGWSVRTRPSIISGNPVNSETSVTGSPASRRNAAVPEVDTSSTPSS